MKLIETIEKELNNQGFYTSIDAFSDKSARWINIFQTAKHRDRGRTIGHIGFNNLGTKVIDFSWHTKKENAFTLNYKTK
jgi:hypothetical protein